MSNVNTVHVVFGAGPAGQTLLKILEARGVEVRLVSRSAKGPHSMAADASDPAAAREAVKGAAVVYNCANARYDRWFADLAPLCRSIADATEAVGARYVVLDNLYMYAPITGPITEATPERPTTRRCILRKELSDELLAKHKMGRMEVTLLRASDSYGPHVTNAFLSDRVWNPLRAGKTIDWIGDPDTRHSYAFIPDVARALADLGARGDLAGQAWILPHAPAVSGRQTLECAAQIIAAPKPKLRALGRSAVNLLGLFMPTLAQLKDTLYQHTGDFVADGSRLEAVLGWSATPLEEGLRTTLSPESTRLAGNLVRGAA